MQVLLIASWFTTSFISLIFATCMLVFFSTTKVVAPTTPNFKLYVALPDTRTYTSDSIGYKDARSKIIQNFFEGYKSLLANYSDIFIDVADKYQLDYRLLPSIAMQESIGGKKVIPDSYNPFGFGIYGDKVVKFGSWEEGIETVGKNLRVNYLNQGLTTPESIMSKYTPPSLKTGGTWAKGVSHFMEQLQ